MSKIYIEALKDYTPEQIEQLKANEKPLCLCEEWIKKAIRRIGMLSSGIMAHGEKGTFRGERDSITYYLHHDAYPPEEPAETQPGEYEVCDIDWTNPFGEARIPEWHPLYEFLESRVGSDTATTDMLMIPDGIYAGLQFEGQLPSSGWLMVPMYTETGSAWHPNKAVRIRFRRPGGGEK